MKSLLRAFTYNAFALYFADIIIPGFSTGNNFAILGAAAGVLTVLNFLVKPFAKILFFPINLVTLGLFSAVINAAIIYLLIIFVPQIKASAWNFPGFHYSGFSIPKMEVSSLLTIFVVSSFISLFLSILNWMRK